MIKINYLGKRYRSPKVVFREQVPIPSNPCAQARWLMRQQQFRVWDTETTGLEDDSKIVSIGIVDQDGNVLLDSFINPGVAIPPDATDIHGITDDMVRDAPTLLDIYPVIKQALAGNVWAIYNSAYDIPRLNYECDRYYLPRILPRCTYYTYGRQQTYSFEDEVQVDTICMMEAFAEYYGDWSDYFCSYKWQKLATAATYYKIDAPNAHNALSDAITTLELIRHMAIDD